MTDPLVEIEAAWAARVERLEARCDELNEACSVKQRLLDHVAEDQRDMLALVEKEKNTLREELENERAGRYSACMTVAAMHAAAMGRVCGPRLGPVEDVAALRAALVKVNEAFRPWEHLNHGEWPPDSVPGAVHAIVDAALGGEP